MPRYLRWTAAASAGLTAWFVFVIAFGAIAVGRTTGPAKDLGAGAGLVASFGSFFVPMLTALAVNDWLANRYPKNLPPAA
jgi:hypothetical protein